MKLKLSAIVALALASSASLGAAEKFTTSTINVYSATPLPSIGLPLDLVPANIQVIKREDLKNQVGVTIADFANNNLQSVSIQETQGNPFQPDVTFRGYSASPLDGNPQGLSVFLDGVRVNEPFGDSVRWDLIPSFAIQGMQLIPGSNPLYGLNTLGGAIALQTKSGRTNQGAALEASGGSWGRKNVSAEYGGVSKDGSVDYYLGANYFDEDGWRKYSPTTVKQTFGKVGWQNESTKIDLSYLNVNNDMIGNGLVPQSIISSEGRDAIYSRPDQTRNFLNQFTLNASHWINNDVMASANAYYRRSNRNTLNGDVNDEYTGALSTSTNANTCSSSDTLASNNNLNAGEQCAPGVNNRTWTRSNSYGVQGQLTFNQKLFDKKNQFIVGTGFDRSIQRFNQTEHEMEGFDATRMPNSPDELTLTTAFKGKTETFHLLATDTISLNDVIHLTGAARYNRTEVKNTDQLYLSGAKDSNSGGNHLFQRINPSLGLTLTPNENVTVFGSYSESARAPSAMELGCSDPANPCLLPNAMASDPPLKQVVAKTYDFGARGKLPFDMKWSASVFQAVNHNDIQFVYTNTTNNSAGYFNNVGRTKRQGLDLGLSGLVNKLTWNASYSYIRATYDTDFTLVNETNSSRTDNDELNVKKGNFIPGIPKHQLKLRAQYQITPEWSFGGNLIAFSSRYMHGNENNGHQANSAECQTYDAGEEVHNTPCAKGKLPAFAIVNLDSQYNLGNGWKIWAKAINVFDSDYYTTGRLGVNAFTDTGNTFSDSANANTDSWRGAAFVSPGAPRAGWLGVRYEFK
ncbi:TonB-dependent receptor [Candidatus Methylopumilus universalis]|uniref:TonB-dependent receptor n=1 Tax=Candidatus Methylopumilus universalis TaxID=2588536 RepID=UPI0011221FF8|nr:TonB-dependent receptor [Candidatus Methylopumilus universalis]QDC89437.1 TonB-dependent receptor [Candidatus Methylopumilus universalis]QDC90738.1 TonB-dependent receptor [Candidatus Methylopumilus universalis]